ncbi:hypothetical protein BC739_008934 [Kutzneria viridogrisea]|uniref:Secreted protein n=1 Tax=Kutzneria viridogrisea TaxID=47990 RepID=A0ABR6BXQ0_9PSEU|nr:hypothetical protein [Kutzneria viridogrisea]
MATPAELSRRAALFAAPAVAAGGLVLAGSSPAAASANETIKLVAARSKNSLPATPAFGTPFAMQLELFDANAAAAGDGSAHGIVVNVTPDTPPKVIVQMSLVLKLGFNGELHLSTEHPLVLPSPVDNPLAIVGGCGKYATARGEGTISYPSPDRINLTLNVRTD